MQIAPETPLIFADELIPDGARLAGYAALVSSLRIQAPVRSLSCVSEGHVRGNSREERNWRVYDKRYWLGDTFGDHLTFALKYEPLDLLVIKRTLEKVEPKEIQTFVLSAPTGAVNRRVWFFYETLTGRTLDIPDAGPGTAVDALDKKTYFTAKPVLSRRHRVRNNLLGNGRYCPLIRRTKKLEDYLKQALADKAEEIVRRTGKHLLARIARLMLLADSQASFEIEGERPPNARLERWGKAVLKTGKNPLHISEIVRLHDVLIEDNRLIHIGLRPDGVFLGERDHNSNPLPEFVGARPDDLKNLMSGLIQANTRMREAGIDAVLQAAATAFGFVYIHPFQDGNGRVHRCLIHHVLAERKFTPPDMVLPVSSVMLDRIDEYQSVLRAHSGPLTNFIEWRATANRNVDVTNDTSDLYRYFDCTEVAEFLYACVERTVEHDLPEEIAYLQRHDEAMRRIMNTVEMPNHVAQDFIMFVRQNEGSLPRRRRSKEFEALTDAEVHKLESIVNSAFTGKI